ncbi:MAG: hypothetical protein OES53_08305 [Xanthomonadales bacterium]|jgi:hypothetical protein|nr:hypothetical protein [Xanthomonadales bacterium]MDH3923891.1 hypothetical protein [Xanthomonadales bacterium]MDH3940992.1 hypothetical protein [Xanthomonadales bacterium]MDH4001481.1 hypothetical protein [Xanthomonadales bacterium]
MNTFLKNAVLVLTASGLLAAGSALADKQQGGRDWKQSRPSVEDVLARMSESLDLSDEQSVELLVILQQHAAEKKALHEQSMALLGPEICAQRAAAEEDVLAILTADQQEQFLLLKEERKTRATERHAGRGGNRPDCSEFETDG